MKNKYIYILLGVMILGIGYYAYMQFANSAEPVENVSFEKGDTLSTIDQMDTVVIGDKQIQEIEKKYGASKVDQFVGNYYIDKQAGYIFEVDNSKEYKLQYNFEKKVKPDDPLLRCSAGNNIHFEVMEVVLQKGMGIDDYVNKWYLPGLYGSKEYPEVKFDYASQTAYFSGDYPTYKQKIYTKCCLKGNKVLVCWLRYNAADKDSKTVKALSASVQSFKIIHSERK